MKRYLTPEESDDTRAKSRRILDARSREGEEEEEEPGGFLDLNSTPRGFDLNDPVAEDDSSHGQSGWLPPQDGFEGKGDTAESSRSVAEAAEQPQAASKVDNESRATKSDDSASSIGPSETHAPFQERDTEEARLSPPKEGSEETDLKPASEPSSNLPVLATLVLQRTLEPALTLGIDEDLDIIRSVWRAHQQNELETLDSVVLEACEELAKSPSNPSRYHYLSCLYVSRKLPEAFGLPKTFKVLVGFLRSPTGGQPTVKRQMMLPVLASKLLMRAFSAEPNWPFEFVQMYLEDATLSRLWIEHEGCKEFVANILTAFPDVDVELSGTTEDSMLARPQDSQGGSGEVLQGQAVKTEAATLQPQGMMPIKNRYPAEEVRAKVRTEFLQALNPLLGTASTKDNPRQLLKLLMQGAGYEEVRVVASSMLEGYLNNPVHLRAAKALLDRILQHTRGTSDNDLNTVANLLALRITSMQPSGQTKSLQGNIFGDMVTQLVKRKPEYTSLALKTFVTAEVNNRNPHNLKSIIMVLKAMPEAPPPEYELALILQELAANDDYRLQLRDFVRRMMKQVGPELDVHALCHGLMQPWPAMGEQHEGLKETWLKQLVDLSCQLLLLSAVPFALDENMATALTSSVGSGASNLSLKEKLLQLEKFSLDTASFQVEAVAWCTDVLAIYLPSMDENQFTRIVRQLLFLESSEVYFPTNESISEVDLVSFRLVSLWLPAPEEILARLILMAISNYPVSQGEALKLIERLVWRAASLKKHIDGALTAASEQLPAAIFKLASFNLPGVTRQPVAQLVVKDMYWRACLVVLIIAAYNPNTIGSFVWDNLPTIRCLMEALLTCTRTFCPIGADEVRFSEVKKLEEEAEQRDSKAEEAISAFLDVTEKRRNDPSSVDVDSRGTSMSFPGSRLTSQGGEWKGKVMCLNQTGPVRSPPKSVVDELNRIDTNYQLGHLLRKSQSPNFLAEITGQQTLPQAWPWLQKILVQAPDVITYLPPVWQCELLFMYEGQHPYIRNLSLDMGKLCLHLRQVIAQQVQSKEGEVESVVDFLSHKLVAKSGVVRVRARRCFSCLLEVPLSNASDLSVSVPSSPQDGRRMDASGSVPVNVPPFKVAGNVVSHDNGLVSTKKAAVVPSTSSQGPSLNVTAVQIASTNLSSLSGGVLRSSPGINLVSMPKDGIQDRTLSWTRAPITGDDCGWLLTLGKVATASRVVVVLAPAIQRAIQQENSVPVVQAYLEFLTAHLSRTSLACCLGSFVVHRTMVASSLLLGAALSFAPCQDAVHCGQMSHSVTIDLILESLCKALMSGTVNDLNWDELALIQSPVVTLVLPHMAADTKELTILRVKVHKIVVDAALKVLSLLSQEDAEGKTVKLGFQQLLNLLFPAFDNADLTWRWDGDIPMGWLEEGSRKCPLLSELQAMSFVQSKNTRLVNAGLSVLSVESKLKVCEHFGFSPEGAAALLAEMNPLKDKRLETVLCSASFSRKQLKKLSNCMRTLVEAEISGGEHLLRVLQQLAEPTSVTGQRNVSFPTSGRERSEAPYIELSEATHLLESMKPSFEEITSYGFEWLTSNDTKELATLWQNLWGKPVDYVHFRQYYQAALIGGWDEEMSSCLRKISSILEKTEEGSLANSKFLSYGLPLLALLSQHILVRQLTTFEPLVSIRRYMIIPVTTSKDTISAGNIPDLDKQTICGGDPNGPEIFTSALVLFRNLKRILADTSGILATKCGEGIGNISKAVPMALPRRRESAKGTRTIGAQGIATADQITINMLELACGDRIEAALQCFLSQNLSFLWQDICASCEDSVPGPLSTTFLSKTLVDLLETWRQRSCTLVEATTSSESTALRVVRDQVEYSGRCGLVMEILGFLDPEFKSPALLESILNLSHLQSGSRMPSGSCTLAVTLASVVHQSSWDTLSTVFHFLLGTDLDAKATHSLRSIGDNRDLGNISSDCDYSYQGWEAVMEFISLCIQHPRVKLACRMSDEKSSSKLTWSWLEPSSACVLTKLAVSASVAAKLGNGANGITARSSDLWIERYAQEREEQALCTENRCLKVLLLAASHGSHIMHAIIKKLSSYEERLSDELTFTSIKTPATIVTIVARSFLQGLYLAFPVSVKAKLPSLDSKLLSIEERKSLNGIQGLQGQTCSLDIVVHTALRSICNGNEKESNAAYGFCQEFARRHPLLVIPHLLTIRLFLKEMLPLSKQGEPQARSTVIRALSMGVGLLDALRPHVILLSNSDHKFHENSFLQTQQSNHIQPKCDLEAVLDVYFKILKDLDVQDRPSLLKVVSRFSDFLCHCVAAGGRIRQYVAAYRTPLIETTAQTFSKLKKMGFLLSLLDKPEMTLNGDDMPASGPVIGRPQNSLSYPQAVSSSTTFDNILKVRAQLQQCIKQHTGEPWREQGLAVFSTGQLFQVSHMGGNLDDGNLSGTLNDLERASARMPAILTVLEDSLVQLTMVKDAAVRERIYNLLERSLLHCPSEGSAANIVQGLLQQLRSSDVLRAKSAARNASRFFHFSPDLQESILVEMLQLGRVASDDLQQLLQGLFSVAGCPAV